MRKNVVTFEDMLHSIVLGKIRKMKMPKLVEAPAEIQEESSPKKKKNSYFNIKKGSIFSTKTDNGLSQRDNGFKNQSCMDVYNDFGH